MGTAGKNLMRNVEINDVVRSLDRFYCYNLAVTQGQGRWATACKGRRPSCWAPSSRMSPSTAAPRRRHSPTGSGISAAR
jgi:hypothetical protein